MTTDERLEILKQLLLSDEKEPEKDVFKKIKDLEERQDHLSERVKPYVDKRLTSFVDEIPETLGPTITAAIQNEIEKSKEAVAEALYPIMGKMIKKYVQAEIKKLNNQINGKLNKTFSFRSWFKREKPKYDSAALYMKDEYGAQIEQIMVVEKGSGLLKAHYEKNATIDQDMLAGMLTAIKSFAEDAYQKGEMELERIDYQLFTIHLQNFSKYYIAVVLSGIYDDEYCSKLEDVLLDFAQTVINKDDLNNDQLFTKKLKEYFTDERI